MRAIIESLTRVNDIKTDVKPEARLDWLDVLYPDISEMTEKLLALCIRDGIGIYVFETLRTPERMKKIYGEDDRWSWHLVGLAVDIYPRLASVNKEDWVKAFNGWRHWDKLQKELAPEAGFDEPQKWQLERDRPHLQSLLGMSGETLKYIYKRNGIEETWKYIYTHRKE